MRSRAKDCEDGRPTVGRDRPTPQGLLVISETPGGQDRNGIDWITAPDASISSTVSGTGVTLMSPM